MPGKKDFVSVKQDEKKVPSTKEIDFEQSKRIISTVTFLMKKWVSLNLQNLDPSTVFWLEPVGHNLFVFALFIKMCMKLMINGASMHDLSQDGEILLGTHITVVWPR